MAPNTLPVLYRPPAPEILQPGSANLPEVHSPPGYEPTLAEKGSRLLKAFVQYADRFLERFRTQNGVRVRTARMLVVVPAHNEEDTIGLVIEHLLKQTRRPDRIVIVADNCTDQTETIAKRYVREAKSKGIDLVVMRTINNTERKVGALTQAWQRHAHEFDFMAGVDGDTLLAPTCLQDLEEELIRNPAAGGIMARYTFDQDQGRSALSKTLIRLQRHEFASWNAEHGYRGRKTYVLGGQATLFSVPSLMEIQHRYRRLSPWDPSAQVEDMELTWKMRESGMKPLVSNTARAYAGPMTTLKALWAQRRKWDEGQARLLREHGFNEHTRYPWRQQGRMFLDLVVRVVFVFLLLASIAADKFRWHPIWLVPPILSVLLNVKIALKMPHRSTKDVLMAALFVPCELYLMFRLASMTVSWIAVLSGSRRDGWAGQYAAERGQTRGAGKILTALLVLALAAYGAAVGWTNLPSDAQDRVLITGWNVLAVVTIFCCIDMLIKLIRPSRGFRP